MFLIAGALEGEIKAFKKRISQPTILKWGAHVFTKGVLEGYPVVLLATGVGKTLSAASIQYAIDHFSPEACIYVGLAGGLDESLAIGDVVVADSCCQWDMDVTRFGFKRGESPDPAFRIVQCDPKLVEAALSFKRERKSKPPKSFHSDEGRLDLPNRLRKGRIVTGDTFLTNRTGEEYSFLSGELHGIAVDMEGYGVCLTAQLNQIPSLLIRVISDKADGKLTIKFPKLLLTASKFLYDIVLHTLRVL